MCELIARGVDGVFENHAGRKIDFRLGQQLGVRDHLVVWDKPKSRPQWMSKQQYDQMPSQLILREVKVKGKVLVTTLINHKEVSKNELGELYDERWCVEVDLRSIKTVMEMDILRCKTPEMVEKEIAVYLLGYNLIRTVMAETACRHNKDPRQISFKVTIQLLNAFRQRGLLDDARQIEKIYDDLLASIAKYRVNNRPGRSEPRVVKRRPKAYPRMTKPRAVLRRNLSTRKGLN